MEGGIVSKRRLADLVFRVAVRSLVSIAAGGTAAAPPHANLVDVCGRTAGFRHERSGPIGGICPGTQDSWPMVSTDII
jgi:hypothetical protein